MSMSIEPVFTVKEQLDKSATLGYNSDAMTILICGVICQSMISGSLSENDLRNTQANIFAHNFKVVCEKNNLSSKKITIIFTENLPEVDKQTIRKEMLKQMVSKVEYPTVQEMFITF